MHSNSSNFLKFAETCEKIRDTPSKLKKIEIVADYFQSLDADEELAVAATFLSSKIFPLGSEYKEINVGYSMLWKSISSYYSLDKEELAKYYRKHGDLGSAIEEYLLTKGGQRKPSGSLFVESGLRIIGVYEAFKELAKATGRGSSDRKQRILERLFSQLEAPVEAKYLVKIMTSEMRIGLVEGLVEDSIAKCFGKNLANVRNANLVTGDIGKVAVISKHNALEKAELELFRPTNFMLADSSPDSKSLYEKFDEHTLISDYKYDGIRAQIHFAGGKVKMFSRNLEDITRYFPEIEDAAKNLPRSVIIDGEIVPFKENKPLSFQALQQRLRKLERSPVDVPVKFFAFDLLYSERPLTKEKLSDRITALRSLGLANYLGYSEQRLVHSPEEVQSMFEESKRLGYEGLVVKSPSSQYTPGRRGMSWVKLKKELDTLDVVIVAAEFGHGKRAGVISDYTFAVNDGGNLKIIGKAYSGLTDVEIMDMTNRLKETTIEDHGYYRTVEPRVILEVAFDAVQKSKRHNSGYALRFPRIKRIRTDKSVEQIDTLERVDRIYESQTVKY